MITEDSDTLAYECPRVLFKLQPDGFAQQVLYGEIFEARMDDFDFRGWERDEFLSMCILSGCDYLSSIQGIGLKKVNLVCSQSRHGIVSDV